MVRAVGIYTRGSLPPQHSPQVRRTTAAVYLVPGIPHPTTDNEKHYNIRTSAQPYTSIHGLRMKEDAVKRIQRISKLGTFIEIQAHLPESISLS